MEVKALFKTLAYRLAEVKAKRVSDMLDHVTVSYTHLTLPTSDLV